MKHFETVDLLRDSDELDGSSGHLPHRQRGAAARIAVELCQDHAGERQRVAKHARRVDRVLPLHRVDDEQRFDRLRRGVHVGDLAHHRLVDREPTRRIDDYDVVVVLARPVDRRVGDGNRFFAQRRRKEIHAHLLRQCLQLKYRGGPVNVDGDEEDFFLLQLERASELRRRRRLACALQSGEQENGGRLRRKVERRGAGAHQRRELAMDDADQRLARCQRTDDFLADRFCLDGGDEVLDDRQRDIRLEERQANFAQRLGDIGIGEARLATQ